MKASIAASHADVPRSFLVWPETLLPLYFLLILVLSLAHNRFVFGRFSFSKQDLDFTLRGVPRHNPRGWGLHTAP